MSIELEAGADRAVIDPERGGRLVSFIAGGRERLITNPPPDEAPHLASLQWGSYVMAPWAGRIRDGLLMWDGQEHQLDRNLAGHAIHGVVHDERWRVVEQTDDRVVLDCRLDRQRWPLGGRVEQEVLLVPRRLSIRVTVSADDDPMPAWIGWHSCFRRPEQGEARIGLDADQVLATTDETIPTGQRLPVSGDLDLRSTPPLGSRRLDDAYVAPEGPLEVRWPDLALDIAVEPAPACAVVFTPRHEFCVEAQTGFPDAVRLAEQGAEDTGLAALEPGSSMTATTTWTWTTPDQEDAV